EEPASRRFCLSLAEAHVSGTAVDWPAFFAGSGAKVAKLPTYPFQGKRYWPDAPVRTGDLRAVGLADAGHPLLAATLESPEGDGIAFSGRISLASHPWLADHAVDGVLLLPGAACAEMALRAGREVGATAIEELVQEAPLVVPGSGAAQVRVSVADADSAGRRAFTIHSRLDDG